jgi:hypothetical protein
VREVVVSELTKLLCLGATNTNTNTNTAAQPSCPSLESYVAAVTQRAQAGGGGVQSSLAQRVLEVVWQDVVVTRRNLLALLLLEGCNS